MLWLQFGYGISQGLKQRRDALAAAAKVVVAEAAGSEALCAALTEWLGAKDNGMLAGPAAKAVTAELQALGSTAVSPAVAGALTYIQVCMC